MNTEEAMEAMRKAYYESREIEPKAIEMGQGFYNKLRNNPNLIRDPAMKAVSPAYRGIKIIVNEDMGDDEFRFKR